MTEVEPTKRLHAAEQSDLRLAITCRTLIAGFALLWYVGAGLVTVFEPRLTGAVALAAYTGIGIAHLCVIGTSLDRWWLKYILCRCSDYADPWQEVPAFPKDRTKNIGIILCLFGLTGLNVHI